MKIPSVFSFEQSHALRYPRRMWFVVLYLWAINVLTILAFGWDKLRARRRKWRVPERSLLWLAALGGGAGAVLGRWIFRHKTRKRGFSIWLFTIVTIQLAVCYLLVTENTLALL